MPAEFQQYYMLRIKRLYVFIITTFLPLFFATFGVCLFIILMQFLWKYVDDMVGKGLGLFVVGKMFFYAALAMVPMALPLAILLASLMAFGNLGEKFELLAMKASGISLLRIMRPIIILILLVSIGAFFFQNNVLPPTQVKLWTLVRSIKLKSPELDIPEKTFYKEIQGYNVYVDHKNKKTGNLNDIMIYDFSKGFDNAKVIVADSGKLTASVDKKHLVFSIFNGESFENLKQSNSRNRNQKIPYLREKFTLKEMLIEFDANFKMEDESFMQSRDLSKNLDALRIYIDSVSVVEDSVNSSISNNLRKYSYTDALSPENIITQKTDKKPKEKINVQTYLEEKEPNKQLQIINEAKNRAQNIRNEYEYNRIIQKERQSAINGHKIEWHRKFTVSFACFIFLFIGAPLGAIIRKGGLGMPAVISVFLFLFYYSINIFGEKLAKQSVLPVWQGMWLSSLVLFSLGIFFTYKAVRDSVMFDINTWTGFFKRLIGKKEIRNYQRKELIINQPDYKENLLNIDKLNKLSTDFLEQNKLFINYFSFWKTHINDNINELSDLMEYIIEDLKNSNENYIIGKLMDYPIINIKHYYPKDKNIQTFCKWFFPIGLIFYFLYISRQSNIKEDIKTILKVNEELTTEINKILISKNVN